MNRRAAIRNTCIAAALLLSRRLRSEQLNRLTLQVKDPTGALFPGADIFILPSPHGTTANLVSAARTSWNGAAEFTLASGTYEALVCSPGFITAQRVFHTAASCQNPIPVTLSLFGGSSVTLPSSSVQIQVVDASGAVIPRASVTALWSAAVLLTDPGGQVLLQTLQPGTYQVIVSAPEFRSRYHSFNLNTNQGPVRITLRMDVASSCGSCLEVTSQQDLPLRHTGLSTPLIQPRS